MRRALLLLALLLLALLLPSCSGSSCDELAGLTERRDAARTAYEQVTQDRQAGRATEADLDRAHDVMHELETRVYDLGKACD